jgi:peptide deformylase
MIYPILAYGDPTLRKKCVDVENSDELQETIANMEETMHGAKGVGLAAPQIGKAIRLFLVDTSAFVVDDEEDEEGLKDFKEVFINAQIESSSEEEFLFEEGCLSIPDVRGDVERPEEITIRYRNQNWEEVTATFDGLKARVIQHEYDHIEGKLFTDYLSPLRKNLIKKRLANISTGKINVSYRMRFPKAKR